MGLICTPYGYSGAAKVSGVVLTYQQVILADKPVAYWPLNETSGTVANDLSGNGYNGTYAGGVTLGQGGIPSGGGSVLLNGSTGYIYSGESVLIDITPFSWEVWIKTTQTGAFLGSGNSNPLSSSTVDWNNAVFLGSNNQFCGHSSISGGKANVYGSASIAPNNGAWHHFVQTYDGTTVKLFQDGVLIGSAAVSGVIQSGDTFICLGNSAGNSNSGFSDWPGSNYLQGNYANAAIYNTALTAAQIQNHYNAGTA